MLQICAAPVKRRRRASTNEEKGCSEDSEGSDEEEYEQGATRKTRGQEEVDDGGREETNDRSDDVPVSHLPQRRLAQAWDPERIHKERWLYDAKSAQRQYQIKLKGTDIPRSNQWTIANANDCDLAGFPAVKALWRSTTPRDDVSWVKNGSGRVTDVMLAQYKLDAAADPNG